MLFSLHLHLVVALVFQISTFLLSNHLIFNSLNSNYLKWLIEFTEEGKMKLFTGEILEWNNSR